MAQKVVTEAGFYAGKFLKPGQSYDGDESDDNPVDLNILTKDELIAEASRLGITVSSSSTKADIVAAIVAGNHG